MDIKSEHGKISLSPLREYTHIEEWLIDLGLSKSWIKKKLTKKELQKKLPRECHFAYDLLNRNMINPHYDGPMINIIFEDETFLVIEKPSGIHGHPLEYSDSSNVLSFIRSINKGKILTINNTKAERGLLYRLDLETSGVLIYIKKQNIFDELFESRKALITKKYYYAVVTGKTPDQQTLEDYLIGTESKGSKMKVAPEGQKANLSYRTKNYSSKLDLSFIEIELETGLRHQIRIQLANSGHPLHGDVKYGGAPADRLYLHAFKYNVDLKKEYCFESNIPENFLFF
jgi:23S rRNA pseudouridine1911/1915/1917 synthase